MALIVLCLFTINLSYVRSRRESVLSTEEPDIHKGDWKSVGVMG